MLWNYRCLGGFFSGLQWNNGNGNRIRFWLDILKDVATKAIPISQVTYVMVIEGWI